MSLFIYIYIEIDRYTLSTHSYKEGKEASGADLRFKWILLGGLELLLPASTSEEAAAALVAPPVRCGRC